MKFILGYFTGLGVGLMIATVATLILTFINGEVEVLNKFEHGNTLEVTQYNGLQDTYNPYNTYNPQGGYNGR